jgi:hypothetical protein
MPRLIEPVSPRRRRNVFRRRRIAGRTGTITCAKRHLLELAFGRCTLAYGSVPYLAKTAGWMPVWAARDGGLHSQRSALKPRPAQARGTIFATHASCPQNVRNHLSVMVASSTTYRLRALASEQRARNAPDRGIKREWEDLALQWHLVAHVAAELRGEIPDIDGG